MSHLVSYKWIRKTQVIPELDVDYNVWDFGCGFDSRVGIHIEDILGNQIQW